MPAAPILVVRNDLAALLRTFRLRRGEKPNTVETRLLGSVQRQNLQTSVARDELVVVPGRLARLEAGGGGSIEMSERDWHLLAEAYGIPRLMLDPLRAGVRDVLHLAQRWDHLRPLGADSPAEYGAGASYLAPDAKLKGTEEAAFVLLELAFGGRSQVHAHPGDELLFVLEGTVEVRLETSGLSVRLDEGDYMHFYAEQRHGVTNAGESRARVFVIRFYQLGRAGTRSELLGQLRAARRVRKTLRDRQVTTRVIHEMIAVLTPADLRDDGAAGADEVRDRGGLGRLLQLLASERFRGAQGPLTVRNLRAHLRQRKLHYTSAKIDRMHHGLAPIPVSELSRLAEAYGTEPLLLYEFLFPSLRSAIAVRRKVDYRELPPSYLGSARAIYRVPCRRLADSDLGVAHLFLPPDTATPVNRHPGHELIIPLRGRVRLRIASLYTDLSAADYLFAHYSSETEHQVVNESREPAEMLVARFYE